MSQIKVEKPSLNQIPELIELWKAQYQFHHDIDSEYHVAVSPQLVTEFESYFTTAIQKDEPHILITQDDTQIVGFITFKKETNEYLDSKSMVIS